MAQSKFEVLEAEVKEMNTNKDTLRHNLLDLIELQHILNKAQFFFDDVKFGCDFLTSSLMTNVMTLFFSGWTDNRHNLVLGCWQAKGARY